MFVVNSGEHHYCQLPHETTGFLTWPQAGYNKFQKDVFIWKNIFSFIIAIVHFSAFWADNSFLPLGCLKHWDSLQSGTEITVWVSPWAAVPWHGKFVCSTYLIAQAKCFLGWSQEDRKGNIWADQGMSENIFTNLLLWNSAVCCPVLAGRTHT